MIRLKIECVRRRNSEIAGNKVTGVGGMHSGKRWYYMEKEAMNMIKMKSASFYIDHEGFQLEVSTFTEDGKKFLSTVSDGITQSKLLQMPDCP